MEIKLEQDQIFSDFSFDFEAQKSLGVNRDVVVREMDGTEHTFSSLKALQKDEKFASIMEKAEQGKIFSIEYAVRGFIDKPNEHALRPKPGEMAKSARMAVGKPLAKDHTTYSVDHEEGLITDAAVGAEGKRDTLDLRVSARRPAFQADFLRGLKRRYSASFAPEKPICSVCGSDVKVSKYGYVRMSCDHQPGTTHKGKFAEILFSVRDFKEVSSVMRGAVTGAKALGASFSENQPEEQENTMDWEAKYAAKQEEHITLKTEFAAIQKERDELAKEKDRLSGELDAAKDATIKYAAKYLESQRLIVAKDEREKLEKAAQAWGVDGAVEFYEQRPPNLAFSAEAAGQTVTDEGVQKIVNETQNQSTTAQVNGKKCGSLLEAIEAI